MSTVADYLGRTVDVALFHGATPAGDARLAAGVFLPAEEVVTGPAKVAQRWLVEFLTEKGSMPYLPDRGCGFMTAARFGLLRTESDVATYFLLAKSELAAALAGEDADADPADERYAGCELEGQSADAAGVLTLRVRVVTAAGAARTVILPLPVTPGRPLA